MFLFAIKHSIGVFITYRLATKREPPQEVGRETAQGYAVTESRCRARANSRKQRTKNLNRPRYSQSELKTFLKCGKMWEFRYARGMRKPPGAALTLGSSVDKAVSANLEQKIESGTDMPEEQVLDEFSTEFDQRKAETEWKEDEDPGTQKDVGAALVALHHRTAAPRIEPETVQEAFVLETDAGYDLEGVIDHTEKGGIIVDTKTSRLAYDQNAIERSFQPTLYDFAYEQTRGRKAEGFRYDVLVKPTARAPARLQKVEGKVSDCDREWMFETITQVHKAISAGVAMPAPEGSWYCSPKWCGYWAECKGKSKGKGRTK